MYAISEAAPAHQNTISITVAKHRLITVVGFVAKNYTHP